jgi:DNA-binding transcriptional regulator YhcF (GntR family)
MGVDRSSDRPVYKQVADALRAAIRSGQLADEQALPSETQLMRQYGVSRNSVRTAVSLLRVEGLVVTEHGRGSFVRAGHTRQRSGSSGYAKARWQARRSPAQTEAAQTEGVGQAGQSGQQLFGGEVMPAPQEVASRLGLGSGECVLVHRHLVLCGVSQPSLQATSPYACQHRPATSRPRTSQKAHTCGWSVLLRNSACICPTLRRRGGLESVRVCRSCGCAGCCMTPRGWRWRSLTLC